MSRFATVRGEAAEPEHHRSDTGVAGSRACGSEFSPHARFAEANIGPRVRHQINGVVAATFDDTDEKKRPAEGIIAFQYHAPGEGFEIRFKDVRIRRMK
jgi:hypothetical protein